MPLYRAELLAKKPLRYAALIHDVSQVLYLPFDWDDGSYARDRSGYNNHGTIYGATLASGKIGMAREFDGVDDYVDVPDTVPVGKSISAFAWTKSATSTWNKHGWIASSRVANGFIIHPREGTKEVTMYVLNSGGGYHWIGAVTPADITIWHFYGLAYDDDAKKAYTILDSVVTEYSLSVTRASDIIPIEIGRDYGDPTRCGKGAVDEFRLYKRVPSAAEIRMLMYRRLM